MASLNLDIHITNSEDLDTLNKRIDRAATELDQLAVSQKKPVAGYKQLVQEIKKSNAALGVAGSGYKQLISEHEKLTQTSKTLTNQYKKQSLAQQTLHSSTRGFAGALGKLWLSYGQLAPIISSFTATMITLKSVQAGMDFDYTTRYIESISGSADEGSASLGRIQEKLLAIEGVAQGPNELAMGLKEFAKAGIDVDEALKPLKNSLDGALGEMSRFATVAEMELGKALEFVIGQANAFADVGFVEAANQVSKAALSSSTSIEQMTEAMKNTTELGTVAGFKFSEISTALALMASKGIRASQAGTSLRTSFLKMLAPSQKAEKIMASLGVHFSAIADDGKIKDMKTQIMELNEATKFLSDGDRTVLFKELTGLRSIKALGALMAVIEDGEAKWDDMADAIAGAGDEVTFLQQKFNDLEKSTQVQLDQLKADFERALIIASNQETVREVLAETRDIIKSSDFKEGLNFLVSAFANAALYAAKFAASISTIAKYTPAALYAKAGIEAYSYVTTNDKGDLLDSKQKLLSEAEEIQDEINRISAGGFEQNGTMLYSPQQTEALDKLKLKLIEVKEEVQGITNQLNIADLTGELEQALHTTDYSASGATPAADLEIRSTSAEEIKQQINTLADAKDEYLRMENQVQRTLSMNSLSESNQVKVGLEEEVSRYKRLIVSTEEYNKVQIDERVTAYRKNLYASSEDLQKAYANEAKAAETANKARLADAKVTQKYIDDYSKSWAALSKSTTSENKKVYKEIFSQIMLDHEQLQQNMDSVSKLHMEIRSKSLKKLMTSGYADAADVVKAQKKLPEAMKRDIDMIVNQLAPAAKEEYAQIKQGMYTAAAAAGDFEDALKKDQDRFIELAQAGDNFVTGFAAGFLDMQDDFKTLGQVGSDIFDSLYDGWTTTGNLIVEAAWTGNLGDIFTTLADTWSETLQNMLKMFVQWLMELAIKWAASGIVELVGSSLGLNLSGLTGGVGLSSLVPDNPVSAAASGISIASAGSTVAEWLGIGGETALSGAGQYLGGGAALAADYSIAAADSMVAAMEEGAAIIGASITEAATGVGASVNAGTQLALAEGTYGAGLGGGTITAASAASIGGMLAPFVVLPLLDAFGAFGGYSRQDVATGVEGHTLSGIVDVNEDGRIDYSEMERNIRNSLSSMEGFAEAISYTGSRASESGAEIMSVSQATALLEDTMNRAQYQLEILAYQFGDTTAQMALDLDGTTESTDYFLDALAGYNVSISESTRLNTLAQSAADGNSYAFEELQSTMLALTGNTETARIATLGMINAINTLSNTTLSIDVEVNGVTSGGVDSSSFVNRWAESKGGTSTSSTSSSSSISSGSDYIDRWKASLGSYDVGSPYITHDQLAFIHQGERVMTPAENKEYTTGLGAISALDSKVNAVVDILSSSQSESSQVSGPMTVVVQIGSTEIKREIIPIIDEEVTKQANRGQLGMRTSY